MSILNKKNAPFCPLRKEEYVRCRQEDCAWWSPNIGACVVYKIAATLQADPGAGATARLPPG